jgi:hypothetical protein
VTAPRWPARILLADHAGEARAQTQQARPCALAAPQVRAARDADPQRLGGPLWREARFECEGESPAVLLVERLPAA